MVFGAYLQLYVHVIFTDCKPKFCSRVVRDDIVTAEEASHLLKYVIILCFGLTAIKNNNCHSLGSNVLYITLIVVTFVHWPIKLDL